MALEKMSVSPADYVVLDVETNGLRSKEHDLLSLSLFKPDDGKTFDKLFPLDLNSSISPEITAINGISKDDLQGQKHLTQLEFDEIISDFELEKRTILHYGELDERFVREYLNRQEIKGFEKLHFFNFKRRIFSSKFSSGNLTKDNLCHMFGIEGVKEVHSGLNDCKLEWELFKKIDGDYLLVTNGGFADNVFRMSNDYLVPVSYLASYPNLSRAFPRPYIVQESEVVHHRIIKIDKRIRHFETNITGITIEHLINTMLHVEKIDSENFLLNNKKKLSFLGQISSNYDIVPMSLNNDGTVTALKNKDRKLEKRINLTNKLLKPKLLPTIEFIKNNIFGNEPIKSQELQVDYDMGILALCDLSTDKTVLEIKTSNPDPARYSEQLYYEARGRDTYLLCLDWGSANEMSVTTPKYLSVIIYRVHTSIGVKPNSIRDNAIAKLNAELAYAHAEVDTYLGAKAPIVVRCLNCNQTWNVSRHHIANQKVACLNCHPELIALTKKKKTRTVLTPEEKQQQRAENYAKKVLEKSNNTLIVDQSSYVSAREPVSIRCSLCGYEWSARTDHVLARCYCPKCKETK